MRAVDEVVGTQLGHGPNRSSFLTDARMGRAVDESFARKFENILLEDANPERLAEHLKQ